MNGPDFVHQFETLANGYEQGCLPTSNILDPWEQGRDYFAQGQLAMVITDFQDLQKVENAGINYGTTAVPTPAGVDPYFFIWSDSVGVMAELGAPRRGEGVHRLPDDRGAADPATRPTGTSRSISRRPRRSTGRQGIPGREEGLEVLSHARPLVFVPDRWDVVGPYYDAWGFVIGGEKAAQEALDEAAPAIQENLDKAWSAWEQQG